MKMNTPTAIFLGLALIAVAIFFRQPSISEAQANINEKQTWTIVSVGENTSHILDNKHGYVYACATINKKCVRMGIIER